MFREAKITSEKLKLKMKKMSYSLKKPYERNYIVFKSQDGKQKNSWAKKERHGLMFEQADKDKYAR